MSARQCIEIETEQHDTLMMGVTPAGQCKIRFADSREQEIAWQDVRELNKFLTCILDRDVPEEPQWQA
ncbi:hypothetical protein [Bifidobacterium scardovii]|uniref:Uncharacterized protein n=1 Tax=Bifidobacterium scardovii TaxID=158787 RepID=A0A087D426_9BIFI|nr:hypothetical protein [Bifidobacterium scardovii]KFI90276.1 hypothetical protein BSCA_1887 [Bifidobacterium scardovii]MDK6350039.1 hypothetical protein [Bifidobacterium scardovii]MDU8982160.1 hypothetical protein [Bifidobacterium scardovii]